jgi:nucleoid DNA-binding protein
VTKQDIIRVISEEFGLTLIQARQIVQNLFDAIVNALTEEGRVELRNFGVFEVRWRKARKGRNPRTGTTVMVPKQCTVIFKPGLAVAERVRVESQTAADGYKTRPEGFKGESSLGVGTAGAGD